MTSLTIRVACDADQPALTELVLEAARHYWGQQTDDARHAGQTADALLSGTSGCTALLALHPDQGAVGFATYTVLHPAPTPAGTLFMKDLYVANTARSLGVGQHIMQYLAGLANELGCPRFDWTAETDNPRAIAFYDKLGAKTVTEKQYFRFDGADLRDRTGPSAQNKDM